MTTLSKRGSQALCAGLLILFGAACFGAACGQGRRAARARGEFGPVVQSYLGYLRAQQEVVDDRVSRREVSADYYRRNSNRIRALRQMAIQIARETKNDYLPELEAVAADELRMLFDEPPEVEHLRVRETLDHTFRYLGAVRSGGEKFYLFARLDPFEQAELKKKAESHAPARGPANPADTPAGEPVSGRPRRAGAPRR